MNSLIIIDYEKSIEKIERIAKEKNLTRTDAILQANDLFIHYKPKKIAKKNVDEILRERGALTAD